MQPRMAGEARLPHPATLPRERAVQPRIAGEAPRAVQRMNTQIYSYKKILTFKGISQKKENWCFAAVTASIHNYYDPDEPVSQEDVVELVFGKLLDKTASARLALNGFAHFKDALDGLEVRTLIDEIFSDRPVVVSTGEHVLVIFGFWVDDKGNASVTFFDPEETEPRTLSWKDFEKEYKIQYTYLTCKA